MKKNKQILGKLGEDEACKYLTSLGFKIIDKNFHKRYSEIDIIALDQNTLVFVEVKTRRSEKYGLAQEAITPWKKRSLEKAAQYFKLLHPHLPDALRIDFVAVYMNYANQVERIKLYKNITSD